ncbi:DNA polymerase I [Clostridium gasigenes]|uniref:DNA polymerase I n=1 Tax=Clostridium gasigenes TaxID=94869 RepID=UPI001C0C04B0|nr:DNA polymerase I [Clostridium gasigenes]MBU3134736.1 DNA polymerase I [Clostridium gasigenes]
MERLLILDSNSLLNRAFFAIPPLTTSEGVNTNAVYGFFNMLFKIKEELKPDYIVATFDRKAPTFRHKEFDEYKAGRKKMAPELAEQFPLVKEILSLLSITIHEIDGFEADDIIGSLAKNAEENGIEVFIVTGDKDALQLAAENINVVITKKGVSETAIYDYKTFVEEFGVTPNQFIDVKGLMGDKSDNIPGVPGIGEKTAFKLIQTYGSVEEVLNNIDNISGKKLKENLETYREQAIFSKKLATIMTEVPIDFDFDEIKSQQEYNREKLIKLLFKLQLKTLIPKLPESNKEEKEEVIIDVKEVNTLQELNDVINNLNERSYITYEISNASKYSEINLDNMMIYDGEIVCSINMKEIIEENKDGSMLALKNFMENEKIFKVINDGKNLVTVLNKMGISIKSFDFDTAIAAYLIDSAKSSYPIITLVNEYLGEEITGEGISLKGNIVIKMKDLYEVLKNRIKDEDMDELYYTIEHPLIFVLSSMETLGFNINKNKLDELSVIFKEEIKRTEKEIFALSEEEFNISSPKQLAKILFEKLDLPVIKKTKTGYSTNAEVLEKLQDKHEIIPKITYYRTITKLNSTYVEGLKNVIDKDGCIHSSFNQTVTTTGRLSSTEPNLQNIPIRQEMGREIRKVFIPMSEGDILLSCDYSQIELRVLAHMAEETNMIDAFKHHTDIHTKTASEVFKVPINEVTSIMRSRAKAVNFGIVYGISDFSLSQDLKITKKEASEYMEIYFERYPKIKGFLDTVMEEAKDLGYVLTLLNRRRFIPEIKSSNRIVKALGERLAMNAPIQGSAADIIKLAMVNVYNTLSRRNLKSTMILQVHDELILNVKADELEEVKKLVKEEMEAVLKLSVPLDVDMNLGKTWYEAK